MDSTNTKQLTQLRYRRETVLLSGSLEATYAVYLRLIRKPIADFSLEIIEHFSLGVTVEKI